MACFGDPTRHDDQGVTASRDGDHPALMSLGVFVVYDAFTRAQAPYTKSVFEGSGVVYFCSGIALFTRYAR